MCTRVYFEFLYFSIFSTVVHPGQGSTSNFYVLYPPVGGTPMTGCTCVPHVLKMYMYTHTFMYSIIPIVLKIILAVQQNIFPQVPLFQQLKTFRFVPHPRTRFDLVFLHQLQRHVRGATVFPLYGHGGVGAVDPKPVHLRQA